MAVGWVQAKSDLKEWLKSNGKWTEWWKYRDQLKATGMTPQDAHKVAALRYAKFKGFPDSYREYFTEDIRATLNVRS